MGRGTHLEGLDRSGDPRGVPGGVERPSGWSGTGRGTQLEGLDWSVDSRRGPGRVRKPSESFGPGWETLE